MKRFPRTLTAAVMAGALAVGGATVAQAQENQPVPGAAATPPARGAAANPEDVKSQEDNEKPAEGDGTGAPAEEGPNENEDPAGDENQGSSDFDKKKLAWLALPAALIIGGIVYHLMKDGQTYTPDEGRKNEDPTAEEKAASDKLLGENKDEVIAQGGQLAEGADAAATDRGIAAETGSNAAARGLAALAVVAMVAAGAFAASRKLFA